jgi:hypothetical protein
MIASTVGPISLAGHPHLIRRDRLDLETDVDDELIELRAVFVTDPGIENDAGLQKVGRRNRCPWSLKDRVREPLGFRLEQKDRHQGGGVDHHQRGKPRSS